MPFSGDCHSFDSSTLEMLSDVGTAQLLRRTLADGLVGPLEIGWKRKDQTTLKVRLSGREVLGEEGGLEAYEVIVEDITKQRE